MIILSHPTGNENMRQAARAFAEAGLLGEFCTTINWNPEPRFDAILPARLRETFRRRAYPEIVRARTRSLPLRETARLLLGAAGVSLFSKHETGLLSIDAISRALDRSVARQVEQTKECKGVY